MVKGGKMKRFKRGDIVKVLKRCYPKFNIFLNNLIFLILEKEKKEPKEIEGFVEWGKKKPKKYKV